MGLVDRGVRHVAVACPAFPTDCLETLEEIGMGLREKFLKAGGLEFTMVPCLNAEPSWIVASSTLVQEKLRSIPLRNKNSLNL